MWQMLHETLLSQLQEAGRLDWSRASVDSAALRAVGGGKKKPVPILPTAASRGVSITCSLTPMGSRCQQL